MDGALFSEAVTSVPVVYSEFVGVTRQTIGLIEAGKYNPTLKLCQAICHELNQTLDDLFWEDKDEKE